MNAFSKNAATDPPPPCEGAEQEPRSDAIAYIDACGFSAVNETEAYRELLRRDPDAAGIVRVLEGCLSRAEVARRYGVTVRSLTEWRRKRRFPDAIRLGLGGESRVWWPLAKLRAWEVDTFGQALDAPVSEGMHRNGDAHAGLHPSKG